MSLPRNALRSIPALTARRTLTTRVLASSLRMSPTQNIAKRRLHATIQQFQAATAVAPTTTQASHEKIASPADTTNFIDNQFEASQTSQWIDLHDPATNNLVTRVPQSTDAELRAAVESAQKAFPAWKATSIMHRQQVMFKLTALIRENMDRLANSITIEQGKTFADAKGDVLRGLQVCETACGIDATR